MIEALGIEGSHQALALQLSEAYGSGAFSGLLDPDPTSGLAGAVWGLGSALRQLATPRRGHCLFTEAPKSHTAPHLAADARWTSCQPLRPRSTPPPSRRTEKTANPLT